MLMVWSDMVGFGARERPRCDWTASVITDVSLYCLVEKSLWSEHLSALEELIKADHPEIGCVTGQQKLDNRLTRITHWLEWQSQVARSREDRVWPRDYPRPSPSLTFAQIYQSTWHLLHYHVLTDSRTSGSAYIPFTTLYWLTLVPTVVPTLASPTT